MTDMDIKQIAPTGEQEESAKQEEVGFSGGEQLVAEELKRQAKDRAKQIGDEKHAINLETLSSVRKFIPYIVPAFIISFAVAGLLFFVTLLYHMLFPHYAHWLDMQQINDIKTILFSGTYGVVVSFLVQKYLN